MDCVQELRAEDYTAGRKGPTGIGGLGGGLFGGQQQQQQTGLGGGGLFGGQKLGKDVVLLCFLYEPLIVFPRGSGGDYQWGAF